MRSSFIFAPQRILSAVCCVSIIRRSFGYSASSYQRRASDNHPLLHSRRQMLNRELESVVKGIIFDMDGTLTEPHAIDFKAMYTRNGLVRKPGDDILTLIMRLPEPERLAALKIIHEEEMLGCERMRLRPNMHNFLHAASRSNIPLALSTRNCDMAYQHFLQLANLPQTYFSPALHRDSLGTINKPDPQVAKHILGAWEIPEGEEHTVWFVGDSVDDMSCGKLAGCRTALITTGNNNDVVLKNPELVDVVVDHFDDLLVYFKLHQKD